MSVNRQAWFGVAAVLSGCALLAGCRGPGRQMANAPVEQTPRLKSSQVADLQVAYGRSLEKTGELDQAATAYQDAVKKDPRSAEALDRLAVMHARKGQLEQAEQLHKKALALQPGHAEFHCNLGYCHYLQRRWAEAETQLRKALDQAPNHLRAYNNLGLVLSATGREEAALASFRQAGCSAADAHCNLAFVLTVENSDKEAQEHYALAKKLDPSSTLAEKGLRSAAARSASSAAVPQEVRPVTMVNAGRKPLGPPEKIVFVSEPETVAPAGGAPAAARVAKPAPRMIEPAASASLPIRGTVRPANNLFLPGQSQPVVNIPVSPVGKVVMVESGQVPPTQPVPAPPVGKVVMVESGQVPPAQPVPAPSAGKVVMVESSQVQPTQHVPAPAVGRSVVVEIPPVTTQGNGK